MTAPALRKPPVCTLQTGRCGSAGMSGSTAAWEPGLMTASDGRVWLRLGVSHLRFARERDFRRAFLGDLRVAVDRLPGVYLDIFLQCRADGSCCAVEGLDETARKLTGALQEWLRQPLAGAIDHGHYERLKAAGAEIRLTSGEVVP